MSHDGDLFFTPETVPSFWHSLQDVQVYLLQDLQCKDFLVVMRQKSPMHSGEVSSNELIHLNNGVANNNHIDWGGLTMSAQRCYF